jgi:hypothetical protein
MAGGHLSIAGTPTRPWIPRGRKRRMLNPDERAFRALPLLSSPGGQSSACSYTLALRHKRAGA